MPSRRKQPRTVRVFLESRGSGPWECSFCGVSIARIGRYRSDGNIHHVDEDPLNDSPDNLAIGHHDCHARHHALERDMSAIIKQQWADGKREFVPQSEEVRQRQAAALRGRTIPADVRERISASLSGKPKTDAHRAAMKAAWASRKAKIKHKQQGETR